MKAEETLSEQKRTPSKAIKEKNLKNTTNREVMANKYAMMREQQGRRSASSAVKEKTASPASVSLLEVGDSQKQSDGLMVGSNSRLTSTWATMKTGLQSFKTNFGAKKFFPLRQVQESALQTRESSSDSLDEIFQRLKQRPTKDEDIDFDFDDDDMNIPQSRSVR